jgi:hypothetical protein
VALEVLVVYPIQHPAFIQSRDEFMDLMAVELALE